MTRSIAAAAGLLLAATVSANAGSLFSGTYVGAIEMICQSQVAGSSVATSGDLEQAMFTIAVTGTSFTLKGHDQSGPMVSNGTTIGRMSIASSGQVTVTGSSNPYQVDLGNGPMKANFDRIDAAGTAHRVTMLAVFSNGEVARNNCSQLITLSR
jgi:hypothetical protein